MNTTKANELHLDTLRRRERLARHFETLIPCDDIGFFADSAWRFYTMEQVANIAAMFGPYCYLSDGEMERGGMNFYDYPHWANLDQSPEWVQELKRMAANVTRRADLLPDDIKLIESVGGFLFIPRGAKLGPDSE